jgi:tripartite-type tricarboxylate transporter receptor subunit TctC
LGGELFKAMTGTFILRRPPLFPDLPTLHEAGVRGYETVARGGVIAPARLPRDLVARLHAEIRKALASPFVLERFRQRRSGAKVD